MSSRAWSRAFGVLFVAVVIPACKFNGVLGGPAVTTNAAALRGSQVVPAVATAATGTATLTIDELQNKIGYSISVAGLGTVTSVRIHFADPGVNGPAMFTLANGPFTSPLTGTLTDADLTPVPGISTFHGATGAILTGRAYVLVSTALQPTGELRGQLGAVQVASAKMTGDQVVPPVVTSVTGTATFQLSSAQDRIDVVLTFTGMATAPSAEIRVADAGAAGPAIFTPAVLPFSSPLSVTLLPADFTPGGGLATFEDAVNALLSGQLYVEIPTTIRGQIGAARLTAPLSAASVVPPNSSTATGTANFSFDGRQTMVFVSLTHTLGTPTGVLIHADAAGSNGPIIFDVAAAAGASTSPLETILTSFDLVPQSSKAVNTFPDAVDAMLTGRTYIDVSSTGFPSGEIRGQILP